MTSHLKSRPLRQETRLFGKVGFLSSQVWGNFTDDRSTRIDSIQLLVNNVSNSLAIVKLNYARWRSLSCGEMENRSLSHGIFSFT
jgi:hypothetical protein